MKKIVALLAALMLALTMTACGDKNAEGETTAAEETTTSVASVIKNAELQHPKSNDLFKYNVYDTYIEITEYIGEEEADEVVVPATLENLPVYVIKQGTFDQTKIKSIKFEEGIYRLQSDFSPYVVNVELPSTLEFVGSGSFENCYMLESVVIPEGITSIQFGAFKHCHALKEVTIPSTVTSLNKELFAYCLALEKVTLNEGLKAIEDKVFEGCDALKTVEIPSTVETIGANLFLSCDSFEEVVIPESVTSIGSGLLSGCTSAKKVTFMNAATVIEPTEGYTVAIMFSQCPAELVVYGKAGSTIAKQAAQEDVYFEVIS